MHHSLEPTLAEAEVRREQQHLDRLYEVLETQRDKTVKMLAGAVQGSGGSAQARVERELEVRRLLQRVAKYDAAETGLCFGRVDLEDGYGYYIGRIGLREEDLDASPLLIDWRAAAARTFYTATAAAPQGVRLRRHLHTRGRRVLRVDDELLGNAVPAPEGDARLTGEAALLATLRADRTGRMQDAIATLQVEQDQIIRSPHTGVLVVQGGPGTGKTVVALHRAAYLLYTHPRLERRGVLVVAPNPVFLSYISQVLPSLGETNVLLATVDQLFPGVATVRTEPDDGADVKGRLVMADVVAAAVRAHQAALDRPVRTVIGGELIELETDFLARTVASARETRLPHNLARPVFCEAVIDDIARQLSYTITDIEAVFDEQLAEHVDHSQLDREVADDIARVFGEDTPMIDLEEQKRRDIAGSKEHWLAALPGDPDVQRLLDRLWPALTPQRLLDRLYGDPSFLAEVAPSLTDGERRSLHRAPDDGWTPADVPLLDEAAELLGHDDQLQKVQAERRRARAIEYAQGVLDIARGSRAGEDDDPAEAERLAATDLVDAEYLAEPHEPTEPHTVAERAALDRTWSFGHVIVDEAQELSPMAWRLLVRRCPTRSFTVIGDVAQTSSVAGTFTWRQKLEPVFGTRWRLEQLTINYRTPAEVMAAADRVLTAIGAGLEPARAIRDGGHAPSLIRVPPGELPDRLREATVHEMEAVGGGRVAVIVPTEELAPLAKAVGSAIPDLSWGPDADLEQKTVVLTATQAKGLEFDSVLVANPDSIVTASSHGLNDLYVALTRSSRRLTIVHTGPVPPFFAHLTT
ncbi:AAA family ATPase [Streptosporangium oxazolinicum]|uniref:AAA family ATPase n=1 Tax=Streptosporangium oxazolinicum TaxID=909287 RepID=A0ABP8BIA3_9ACTN